MMRKRSGSRGVLLWTVVATILAGGSACDRREPARQQGSISSGSGKRQVESNEGNYVVAFETVPDPIPMNEPFALKFTVAPRFARAAKAGGEAFDVEVDARMPAHFHGMNRSPKVTRQPDGSFQADGMLFHMPGHWELYFDIWQGAGAERAQCSIDLK